METDPAGKLRVRIDNLLAVGTFGPPPNSIVLEFVLDQQIRWGISPHCGHAPRPPFESVIGGERPI